MNDACELGGPSCREHCARQLRGLPECESQWECEDPRVMAQCAEETAREIRAEQYNDAVVFNGGIHPANWHDEPDPNDGPDNDIIPRR